MANTRTVKNRSVTKQDVGDIKSSGVLHFMLGGALGGDAGLPAFWSPARDYVLRNTIYMESFWASGIQIALTKMAGEEGLFTGSPRLRQQAQELWLSVEDSQSPVAFLSKQLRDYLLTDNGSFYEVIRATSARGSKIIGVKHLDSLRCQRTGDLETPILYRDRKQNTHELKSYQVVAMSDMPEPSETYFGVGFCAASRGFKKILTLSAVEMYKYEKVSGKRPLSIYLVNGFNDEQIKNAMKTAEQDATQRGASFYMGAVVITHLSDIPPGVIEIPLAKLPDGFDDAKELDSCLLAYSKAIGLDPQDLQPLAGRALGTAMQSEVLHDKSSLYGLSLWQKQFEFFWNQNILSSKVMFTFSKKDLRDQLQRSQLSKARADAVRALTGLKQDDVAIISPQQAMQILVDLEELPRGFAPAGSENLGGLSDQEKPAIEEQEGGIQPTDQLSSESNTGATLMEKKSTELNATELLAQELKAAIKLSKKVTKKELVGMTDAQ